MPDGRLDLGCAGQSLLPMSLMPYLPTWIGLLLPDSVVRELNLELRALERETLNALPIGLPDLVAQYSHRCRIREEMIRGDDKDVLAAAQPEQPRFDRRLR